MEKPMIRLRALTKQDIERTLTWHNQEDIQDLYIGHPFPVNREMEELKTQNKIKRIGGRKTGHWQIIQKS